MANTSKGNKPDFHRAMSTEPSRELYVTFLEKLGQTYKPDKIQGMVTSTPLLLILISMDAVLTIIHV
ncbi:hypothetical protein H0H87_003783 [Tephrocybe sp. NHM501043]|nr:hypothetical protein H0H87_003783 [Tephrocybe sp. NHM501043]